MTKWITYERVGELFCGPGGSGIGVSMSGFETADRLIRIRHVWASDYDKDSCHTYEQNISQYEADKLGINEKVKVIHVDVNDPDINVGDVTQFDEIDGLIFGFPCNDFSLVGESKGLNGKFGPLYKHGIKISLLSARGAIVPKRSGLNWGQRPEVGREPNQAYSALYGEAKNIGFLPDRARTFTMITDDNQAFDMAVQQDSRKAISTSDNSELGRYFRQRLGLVDGELVTKKHLEEYGRTDYTIEKIDEETFLLDFSI